MKSLLQGLFGKERPSPSYPVLPVLSAESESNIKGLFMAGEVAGRPLIKIAMNDGYSVAETIEKRLNSLTGTTADYDVIVAGAGIAGTAAAIRLKELERSVLVLDSGKSFQNLRNFTKGKLILAEPENMTVKTDIPFAEGSIEETLSVFDDAVSKSLIEIREHTGVSDIQKDGNLFTVTTERGTFTSKTVLLSVGKAGNPRKAGVPGELEHPDKIAHFLKDPDDYTERDILIYGGGDVAAEAAIALADTNRVTLVTIDEAFIFPKKANIDKMKEKESAGNLTIIMGTGLKEVGGDFLLLQNLKSGEETRVENEFLFEMIGAEPPTGLFTKAGIKMEKKLSRNRMLLLTVTAALSYLIYAWKKGYWPFKYYAQFVSHLPGIFKNPSFWYSALYTVLMVVFGLLAMRRWSRGWTDRHQIARFASLIIFQILSFGLIECLFAVYLPGDTWWRAYAVNNPFPLLFDSFYNLSGVSPTELKWIIAATGFVITFVVIPIAVRYHGKRFCTWICGCGGLAETLGDTWRHLSPKGEKSRRWEFMGTVVLFWAVISALVIFIVYNGNTKPAGLWHSGYVVVADFWLIAVIPVALYPILGGKIWCRYWCPLAKYMEFLSSRYGKLKITANDKCIQCTQCSLYCQVGVDVMAFAKNEAAFSNKETSCIHCGICITVCPMDVLKFER